LGAGIVEFEEDFQVENKIKDVWQEEKQHESTDAVD
jgi:hypothetical protein